MTLVPGTTRLPLNVVSGHLDDISTTGPVAFRAVGVGAGLAGVGAECRPIVRAIAVVRVRVLGLRARRLSTKGGSCRSSGPVERRLGIGGYFDAVVAGWRQSRNVIERVHEVAQKRGVRFSIRFLERPSQRWARGDCLLLCCAWLTFAMCQSEVESPK